MSVERSIDTTAPAVDRRAVQDADVMPRQPPWFAAVLRVLSVHGLLLLLIALIVVFSLLRPETFPTSINFQAITSARAVVAMLALAVMIPLAANEFDLSVGYLVGLG